VRSATHEDVSHPTRPGLPGCPPGAYQWPEAQARLAAKPDVDAECTEHSDQDRPLITHSLIQPDARPVHMLMVVSVHATSQTECSMCGRLTEHAVTPAVPVTLA
jgi:hypothetical protein